MRALQEDPASGSHVPLLQPRVFLQQRIRLSEEQGDYKNVTIINRAHTMNIVPNAIEIVCNGKCEFFTSFIFPDKAYRTITAAWKECSRYSKIFAAADLDQSERTTSTSSVPQFAVPPSPEIAAMLGLNPSESGGGGGPGSAGSGGGEGLRRRRRRRRPSLRLQPTSPPPPPTTPGVTVRVDRRRIHTSPTVHTRK